MNYQELMFDAVIEWSKELDAHNGRWTRRAHDFSALASKYSTLLRYQKTEEESK